MASYSIERFIEEANRAKAAEAVSELFDKELRALGYDRFCYCLVTDHPSLGLKARIGVESNYPDDWKTHYWYNRFDKSDPTLSRFGLAASGNGLRPYSWDLLRSYDLNAGQKRVLDEFKDARLLDGISVPICAYNGEMAGIGMASSIGGVCGDKHTVSIIHALSVQFHSAYTELRYKNSPNVDTDIHLTCRETEILSWVAEGKSDAAIADIVGLSYGTIRFHMNNIFKKLNANERRLAVIKAVRLGLIVPSYFG
jgi:DNA-binding CsgD family transcriptional regulator